jgi:hypothetical protein
MSPRRSPSLWTPAETALFKRLDAPIKIQGWLNALRYDPEPGTRSPRWVIRERKANCFEGAILGAAALRTLGYPPLLVDMRSHNDDDHVLAVFRRNSAWGCVAKSNFTVLRYREPVYRTVRELMMSFFDVYFNAIGEKTLRAYSVPFDLCRFDRMRWMTTDEDISEIGDALDKARHYPVLSRAQVRALARTDPALVRAGLMGSDPKGLFKPRK